MISYMVSDSLIAIEHAIPYRMFFITWPLYYAAQIGITFGLLKLVSGNRESLSGSHPMLNLFGSDDLADKVKMEFE